MSEQTNIFFNFEGDNWFNRNLRNKPQINTSENIYVKYLKQLEIKPNNILEIGCSDGVNIHSINCEFGSNGTGIDPSKLAIESGRKKYSNLKLEIGSAENLNFKDNSFDLVIFGFCLYLCERKDLFKIVYEADRCLQDNGHLIIMDFLPGNVCKNIYSHTEGVYSYKMDYSNLFLSNPNYHMIFRDVTTHSDIALRKNPNERIGFSVLHKNLEFAYPYNAF
jgi:ubiquinone/menaquinone biosynthesis C-methylase UbiE